MKILGIDLFLLIMIGLVGAILVIGAGAIYNSNHNNLCEQPGYNYDSIFGFDPKCVYSETKYLADTKDYTPQTTEGKQQLNEKKR